MIEDQFMYRRDNSCTARCNYSCSYPTSSLVILTEGTYVTEWRDL